MENKSSLFFTFLRIASISAIIFLFTALGSGSAIAQQTKPTYDGKENHTITFDTAVKYIKNFGAKADSLSPKGGYFGRLAFEQILAQKGCVGIRYYFAKTDSGASTLILVGVDSTGADLSGGVICDKTYPCPPYCTTSGGLNK